MPYRIAAFALVFSCFAFGQKNKGSADRVDLTQQSAVEAKAGSAVVGNERTVGASPRPINIRKSDDGNLVGNAKTVGGAASYATAAVASTRESVGNSKTVGGR